MLSRIRPARDLSHFFTEHDDIRATAAISRTVIAGFIVLSVIFMRLNVILLE